MPKMASRPLPGMDDISVLIAEDDSSIVQIIDMLLRDLGITKISRASNGKEALKDLGRNLDRYSLIISDWNMPEVSGLDLLRMVRSHRPDLPFLMLTGRTKKEEILAAVKAGVSAYISKPFTPVDLQKKIATLCKPPETKSQDDSFVDIC
jgi:two-component system chemotaxis response regulator CheY